MIERNASPEIHTERLTLRPWREADREPFAAMCADSRVMEYFESPLTRDESERAILRMNAHIAEHGFGFWAVEERASGAFAGMNGLKRTDFEAAFTPAVELGWRLRHGAWGRGFASEAARACLAFAFQELKLPDVVAIAAIRNLRSRAVMERIGMSRNPDEDFIHPKMPPDHALQPCVLYRMKAADLPNATRENA
jgi:RimJ/RimL family protein N-acetyltransferase